MPKSEVNPKPIHIFKPGRHMTMGGDTIEFSVADVKAIANAYDPSLHEAPLVVGHPKSDAPAHGWVESLYTTADGLFAIPRKVSAAFAEQVKSGAYGKVSSKFYAPDAPNNPTPGTWALCHVGFLGATPPAVKGLRNPEFSDVGEGCVAFQESVEFGDWDDRVNAGLWRGLRDWFIGKFGQDEADKALPSWSVDSLQESAAQPEPDEPNAPAAFSEENKGENNMTPQQIAQLNADLEKVKCELAQVRASEAQKEADALEKENIEFAEGLIKDGRLAPKDKDLVVAVLGYMAVPGEGKGKVAEFGEGNDKQSLASAMKGFLSGRGKVIEFGEIATPGRGISGVAPNPLIDDAASRAKN